MTDYPGFIFNLRYDFKDTDPSKYLTLVDIIRILARLKMIVDVAINKPLWKTLVHVVSENADTYGGTIIEVPFRNSIQLGLVLGIKKIIRSI